MFADVLDVIAVLTASRDGLGHGAESSSAATGLPPTPVVL